MYVVAVGLLDGARAAAVRIDDKDLKSGAVALRGGGEVSAIRIPEGLLPVARRGERPSARAVLGRDQSGNTPVPLSAEYARVVPSDDHQGWRLSPGRSVIWRGLAPSGDTVQILSPLPPRREK